MVLLILEKMKNNPGLRFIFVIYLFALTKFMAFSQNSDTELDTLVYFTPMEIIGKTANELPSFEVFRIKNNKVSLLPRIENILNFSSGIQMQTGALNTNRITIRGIGSRSPFATSKLRAYIDDIPITDGVGETSLEDINLQIIDKIKLWKGPSASRYGASLGGVIQYQLLSNFPSDLLILTDQQIGDFGLWRNNTAVTKKIGERDFVFLNYERIESDGYRMNNDYNKSSYTGLYKINRDKSFTTFFLNAIQLKAQIPSSINFIDYSNNPSFAASNWANVAGFEDNFKMRMGISHALSIATNTTWTSTLFGSYFDSYELRPFNIIDDDLQNIGFRSRLNVELKKGEWVTGTEMFFEKYHWQLFDIENGEQKGIFDEFENTRKVFNIFTEYSYPISSKLNGNIGINLNFTSFSLSDLLTNKGLNSTRNYPFLLSPRLAINYNMSSIWKFTSSLSHGFATPNLDESLNNSGQFNEEINQEKAWNFEIGFKGEYTDISYSFSLFRMYVNDIIVNRQNANGSTFGVNAGSTRHTGLETVVNYNYAWEDNVMSINFSSTIGEYVFSDFMDNGNNYSGNDLTGVAPHQSSLRILSRLGKWTIAPSFRYTSSIPINDANSDYSENYFLSHFRISKLFTLATLNMEAGITIENIFNTKYASMLAVNARSFGNSLPRYYYPGNPRNILFGVKIFYQR